jgi:DNA-binding NarL/FixJ family response regulator
MSEPVREPTSAPDGDATRCDAPLAVLLVEDNPGDAGLLQALLDEGADAGRAGGGTPRTVSVRWVQRLSAAREALADGGPVDVVLLDLTLPDARGMDTVSQMRAAAPSLPVVVLTGLDDEALALRAMQAGAQDYLVKGAFTGAGLHRALHRAVERQRLVDAARRATAARDLVLGVVAHDLRDPLSAIKMCAGALGRTPTAESVGELAGVVRQSAEWMERIIRDLLDVTTIEAGRLAVDRGPLSAAAVAEQLRTRYTPLAAERGCALRCEVARALPPVDADGERLAAGARQPARQRDQVHAPRRHRGARGRAVAGRRRALRGPRHGSGDPGRAPAAPVRPVLAGARDAAGRRRARAGDRAGHRAGARQRAGGREHAGQRDPLLARPRRRGVTRAPSLRQPGDARMLDVAPHHPFPTMLRSSRSTRAAEIPTVPLPRSRAHTMRRPPRWRRSSCCRRAPVPGVRGRA